MLLNNLKSEGKRIVRTSLQFFVMLAILAISAILLGQRVPIIMSVMKTWPREILALVGVWNINLKNQTLTLFYIVMVLFHMFAIVKSAGNAVEAVKEDEENGTIRFFINQPYSRDGIFFRKAGIAVLSALIQWSIYILLTLGAVYFVCLQSGSRVERELQAVMQIGMRGSVFVICMTAIALLYSVMDNIYMTYGYLLTNICTGSFILGNIYKIFDVVVYYLGSGHVFAEKLNLLGSYAQNLRILFPFTLLNILNLKAEPLPEYTYLIYGMVSMILILTGWCLYRRKEF